MMGAKVKTNHEKGSIVPLPYKRKVRLLLWGGAYKTNDNFTFEWTVRKVVKDYKARDQNKYEVISKKIESASDLLAALNGQEDNSIRSLDLFTHGGPEHFYMVSVRSDRDGGLNNFRWYRYIFHNRSFPRSYLGKVKFSKFTENAKVEIHGCQTAKHPKDENNIAADFSRRLYSAGKTKSAVIGHTTNIAPNINGAKTTDKEQDYRHGERAIFKNGQLVRLTLQRMALDEEKLSQ
ncbi:hypothetical protein [Herbaspirillum sp. B65]|uniref:hypothetical protein n=1 Tax=Herbaspirillum sp. B65 TaxID=137708 RepID=UPI0005C87C72|nr:hypothetical protein [Herbaspirillum sp. B65]